MPRLILRAMMGAAALILTVLAAGAMLDALTPDPGDGAYRGALQGIELDRRQLDLDRARADAAREQVAKNELLPWLIAAQVGALLLAGGLALAGGAVLLDAYRQRRRPVIILADGQAALPRAYVEQTARPGLIVLQGQARAREIAAAVPLPVQTYAPHFSNRQENLLDPGADAPQLPAPVTVPTLGQAIDQGLFKSGQYLLGYAAEDGAPIRLDAPAGRSLLIAGHGGAGGSTALAGAALQELCIPPAYVGTREPPRYILLDSHGYKPDSLTHRLQGLGDRIITTARTPAEVGRAVAEFRTLLQRRLDHPAPPSGYPFALVLLADECSDLFEKDSEFTDQQPAIAATFLFANQEARNVGGKAIARFHAIPAYSMGGRATIRKSFRSRAVFALDPADGETLGLPPALARDLVTLPTGQCIIMAPGVRPVLALAPNVEPDAPARALAAAGLWTGAGRTIHTVPAPVRRPVLPRPETPPAPPELDGPQDAPAPRPDGDGRPALPLDQTGQEILRLYGQGVDPSQIVKALWPDAPARGKTLNEYMAHLSEVNMIVRLHWRGPGAPPAA
jgi:hypothetical protein